MLTLSPDQDTVLNEVLAFLTDPHQNEMALSGPGGSGKSQLTAYILEEARKQNSLMRLLTKGVSVEREVHLTSTTNKAAKVLWEATGEPTGTIHSLLGLRPYKNFKTGVETFKQSKDSTVITGAFIIIDEASMINQYLLDTIRKQTHNCKTLYIGDSYQLAPVFENTCPVFKDIKHQTALTKIHRQAAGSPIIQFASKFRQALDTGIFPKIESHGPQIQLLDGPEMIQKIKDEFTSMTNWNHARVVTWTNDRVHELNTYIRKLNTSAVDYEIGEMLLTNKPVVDVNGQVFLTTDSYGQITDIAPATERDIEGWYITLNNSVRVFQARNQDEVTNLIKHYKRHKDWQEFYAVRDFFSDLRPIYACTTNKAQGSTYRNVFIDVDDIARNTKNSEIARLMYTAITRASDVVYMNGNLPKRLLCV